MTQFLVDYYRHRLSSVFHHQSSEFQSKKIKLNHITNFKIISNIQMSIGNLSNNLKLFF